LIFAFDLFNNTTDAVCILFHLNLLANGFFAALASKPAPQAPAGSTYMYVATYAIVALRIKNLPYRMVGWFWLVGSYGRNSYK